MTDGGVKIAMSSSAADPAGFWKLVTGLCAVNAVLFLLALSTGPADLSLLSGHLFSTLAQILDPEPETLVVILREIRLPRAILAVMVGATMGLTGAALQGLLRNPLAAPGLIGVSASAAFGAVVTMYFGISAAFPLALPLGGMAGAMVSVIVVYALAGRDASVLTLILAGVAVSSLAGALTSLALNLAPSPYAVIEIAFWLLGSLADRSFDHVQIALAPMLLGWALLTGLGRPLDALTLGEDTARSLGFNLVTLRWRVIVGTALSVGAAVSVAGAIGFVGLVIPHLLRPFVGYLPGRLMGVSALGGSALVLAGDVAVRYLSAATTWGTELKLGVLTALIGAPFFLYLVLHTRRTMR
ncbi:MAG: iron ABC transporter permease [Rhodospirillales bacterium]|nr:iron ABC transporter permease [Rhodospirillales bacterium]